MGNLQLFRLCTFIGVIFSISYSDDSCGDVQIASPYGDTINASVNDWVNMTFELNTDNCSGTYLVTVEKQEQGGLKIVCRIQQNKTSCFKTGTETMYSCRCVSPVGPVELWEKLVQPGNGTYRWRWTDFSSGKQGEKKINVHVAPADTKIDVKHFQRTKFILVGVGGLLVVVAVVLIFARCQSPRFVIRTMTLDSQAPFSDNIQTDLMILNDQSDDLTCDL